MQSVKWTSFSYVSCNKGVGLTFGLWQNPERRCRSRWLLCLGSADGDGQRENNRKERFHSIVADRSRALILRSYGESPIRVPQTRSAFHPRAQRDAFRRRDVRQQRR